MVDENVQTPPPDYNPAIPEQLRKQIKDAEALRASMDAPAPQDAGAGTATPPEGGQPTPSQPGAGVQPPAAPPPAGDDDENLTWEQRFRSQQGRYEQMLRSNQALSERINELQQSMLSMQARGVDPQPVQPAAERAKPRYVTEEEESEYGEEFMDVVGRRAREQYAPEFDELSERLKRIESQVQGVGKVVEHGQKVDLYTSLAQTVPNWKEVNRSEDFKTWLSFADPFSGRRRMDLLTEAFTRHETGRVISFFQGFLTEAAGLPRNTPSPGSAAPPLASPQNGQGNGSGRPSLEDFAAPGRARSGQQPLPPEKPIYTQAWIAKFMADKRTGKYRGREADANAIELDIYQAQHEGRLQP